MNFIKSLYRRPKVWVAQFWSRSRRFARRAFLLSKEQSILSVLTVFAFLGVVLIVFVWINYFDWLRMTGDGVESGSTTIRNVGFLIAGLIALPLAIWRSMVAQEQANTAQQSLLNERYQQGAEMLGSDVLAVRLGGIYALRSLAEEHPEQYHVQAIRLLCAFVRNPTKDDVYYSDGDSELRGDVQIALDAICACHEINVVRGRVTQFWLDLRDVDLEGARLESVDMSVELSPSGKTLAEIVNSHQFGADFDRARLNSANMSRGKFSEANFSEAGFVNANLQDANLSGANLYYADLSNANLFNVNLQDANLSGASLRRAALYHANLGRANLSGARLWDANLSGARLQRANLSGAMLWDANLSGARLRRANLSGAQFVNQDSRRPLPAQGLTQSQLDKAHADPDNPPNLEGALDPETGEPLVWRGKPLND